MPIRFVLLQRMIRAQTETRAKTQTETQARRQP